MPDGLPSVPRAYTTPDPPTLAFVDFVGEGDHKAACPNRTVGTRPLRLTPLAAHGVDAARWLRKPLALGAVDASTLPMHSFF